MPQKNYSPHFANNLNLLINHLNLSKQEFATQAEITPTILSLFLHGKSQPNRTTLMRLVEKFNVSLDWLLFDKGTMFGMSPMDLTWYQAIISRLILAQMKDIGIKEAVELQKEVLKENVDINQWSEEMHYVDNQIWELCAINEKAVSIYNTIIKLGTESERIDYLNQVILCDSSSENTDNWQVARQHYNREKYLKKLYQLKQQSQL